MKKKSYQKILCNNYFWRIWDQHEIDLVEEKDGKLFGFEFKWNNVKKTSKDVWLKTYKESSFQIINQNNYLDFIS